MNSVTEITKKAKPENAVAEKTAPGASKAPLGVGVTGSVAVLEAFIAEGVKTIFGYPGGAIMPIYDALYDYNEKLQHILVRH
jgi:acetolactate synthase-1/2/3 large subunit